MSTSNGFMAGKGRKVLNLLIEEAQHKELGELAKKDRRSLATVVRALLRQGLDTRHGLSTRQVASRVDEHLDKIGGELAQEVKELRAIVVNQKGQIDTMAREISTTKALLEHVATLLKERLPEKKKGWL